MTTTRTRRLVSALITTGLPQSAGAAGPATTLKTTHALQFADAVKVPAGAYTIWLIPGKDAGTFIINSETGQCGTQYKVARDLTRFPVRYELIAPATLEQFTARVAADSRDEGRLLFEWDGRRYAVPFLHRRINSAASRGVRLRRAADACPRRAAAGPTEPLG